MLSFFYLFRISIFALNIFTSFYCIFTKNIHISFCGCNFVLVTAPCSIYLFSWMYFCGGYFQAYRKKKLVEAFSVEGMVCTRSAVPSSEIRAAPEFLSPSEPKKEEERGGGSPPSPPLP